MTCATAEGESYAQKTVESWNGDGETATDRGTLLYMVFTDGASPQIAATKSLKDRITPELKSKLRAATANAIQEKNLPALVITGLNAITDVVMDTPAKSTEDANNQTQAPAIARQTK